MESKKKTDVRSVPAILEMETLRHKMKLLKKDLYPRTVVQKLECVGHVRKRVGGCVRKLKSSDKAPLSDCT